ncbi:AsmA-like C-terminal region-containing protein [Poseidonocella sedimentorum]|uniref:AsmA-like C-terminal region n=1 Tax=Poseidonocella sedimentorum TaxID=871652 RepID=A0A1I6DYY5_9RHOB|nr:AsmA-like C-terminal region-containing protein [Poseidonocella sedimentorum]SFR10645.1 AsmA-like C-terminal region [Poseidonocella sedimentorum]
MTRQDREKPARDTGARRWLGRSIGWGAAALLVSALLVGAVGFYAYERQIEAPDWVQRRVVERIAEVAPEADVRFEAMVFDIAEFRRPGVRLRDVTIGLGGAPAVRLDDVNLGFSVRSLLNREIMLRSVSVIGGSAAVRRAQDLGFGLQAADGGAEAEPLSLQRLRDDLGAWMSAPRLARLRSITVQGFTLRYEDAHSGRAWTADDGTIRITREAGGVELSSTVTLLGGATGLAVLEANLFVPEAQDEARFALRFDQVASEDLASQLPALAWMEPLRAPISGALRGVLDEAGALGPVAATMQIGKGVLQPNAQTKPVPFDMVESYVSYDPATGVLSVDDFTLSSPWVSGAGRGHSRMRLGPDGWPEGFDGQVVFTELSANPQGMFDTPRAVESARFDTRLSLDPFRIELGQGSLVAGADVVTISGEAVALDAGWSVSADAQARQIAHDTILNFWPPAHKVVPRQWIAENIRDARYRDLNAALRLRPGGAPALYLGTGFEGARLRFLKHLPEATGLSGYLEIHDHRLVATSQAGSLEAPEGGVIDIAGSVFELSDMRQRPMPATVRLAAEGPIPAILSTIDRPPFRFMSRSGRGTDLAQGTAAATGEIAFPLKRRLTPAEVRYHIAADLRDVSSEMIVPGRRIAAPALRFAADNTGLRITGEGTFDGVPFDGQWSRPFRALDGSERPATVDADLTISPAGLDALGIALPPGTLTGETPARIAIALPQGAPPEFTLTSELRGAALRIDPLGWRKGPGAAGRFEISGALATPARIDRIALSAPGLDLEGTLSLTGTGAFSAARFSRLRSGGWLDAPVTLTARGAGEAPAIAIGGGRVDLRARPETGGGAGRVPLDLSLDRLVLSDEVTLTGLRGQLTSASGLSGVITGRINGKTPVRAELSPQNGRTAIRLTAEDAGRAMRDAGLLERAREGALDLRLVPRAGPGSYDGSLSISDVRLQNLPALAQLLDAISVVGILDQMRGPGIFFENVDAKFRLTPSRLTITEARATGPSLGITVDGIYDRQRRNLDMQGVLSPIYAINMLGGFLARKGEGLIGFTYTVTGDPAAPRIGVNPLSALTPGFLREIFRRPAPVPEEN